jgi:hypothetical protein
MPDAHGDGADPLTVGKAGDYTAPKDRPAAESELDEHPLSPGALPAYPGGVFLTSESSAYSAKVATRHYGMPGYEGPHVASQGRVEAEPPATRLGTWGEGATLTQVYPAHRQAESPGEPGVPHQEPLPPTPAASGGLTAEGPVVEQLEVRGQLQGAAHSSANLESEAAGTSEVEDPRAGADRAAYDERISDAGPRDGDNSERDVDYQQEPHESGDFAGTGGSTHREGGDMGGTAGSESGPLGSPEQLRPSPRNRP